MTKYISGYKIKRRVELALTVLLYISTAMTCALLLFSIPHSFIRPYILIVALL